MFGDMDRWVLVFINRMVADSLVLDVPLVMVGDGILLRVTLGAVIAALAWKGGRKGRTVAVLAVVCLAFTDVTVQEVLRGLFCRLRPSQAVPGLWLPVGHGGVYGFPSSHAANAFAVVTLLAFFYRRQAALCFIVAGFISFSRVCAAKHYPSGILVGAIYGVLMAWVFIWIGVWWLGRSAGDPADEAGRTA